MKRCGLPNWLYVMMAVFFIRGVDLERNLDHVDFFGGACGVRDMWNSKGCASLAIEILHDSIYQNLNGDEGFVTSFLYGSKLRPGGLGTYGVVCSTWIWVCSKSTGRHLHPMGNQSKVLFMEM